MTLNDSFTLTLTAAWSRILPPLWARLQQGEAPGDLVAVVVDDSMPWPDEVRGAHVKTRPEAARILDELAKLYPDNAPALTSAAGALADAPPEGYAWALVVTEGKFYVRWYDPAALSAPADLA